MVFDTEMMCLNCYKQLKEASFSNEKFCSKKCMKEDYRKKKLEKKQKEIIKKNENKECLCCKQTFFRKDYFQKNNKTRYIISDTHWKNKKFCNEKCANKYKARKKTKQNPNWWKEAKKKFNKKNPNYSKERYLRIKNNPILWAKKKEKNKLWRENNKEKVRLIELNNLKKLKEKKKRIHEVYHNKCAICGYDKVLDIHHIDGKNGEEENKLNKNKRLIVLCPNCHLCFHRGITTKNHILKYYKKNT